MAYLKINRSRFEYLLRFGADDDELRRFFSDKRTPLIQKGARVQNLPRGFEARVHTLASLPPATDPILLNWFSTNLTMLDPVPAVEVVDTFRMYEEMDEAMSVSDTKRLSRSCLVHLFSDPPPQELLDFLGSPLGGNGTSEAAELDSVVLAPPTPQFSEAALLSTGLADSLVAVVEGKDPDEFVSELPPAVASFLMGLHAVRSGSPEEIQNSIEELEGLDKPKAVLASYATRYANSREFSKPQIVGLQIMVFEDNENQEFDLDKDEIIGICTKDSPESSVFVRPFAIRTESGKFLSLSRESQRIATFPNSGDVMAFHGHGYPRQPKRNEIGIWHVHQNPGSATHRSTNFHLAGKKTEVFEIRSVPFSSDHHDSVREFIKDHVANEKSQANSLLFLLRDNLIVGCPSGKDLTRDEGFEQGMPCWRMLPAFKFEGRLLVPGPLPAFDRYECDTLASSLKKLLATKKSDSEKLTKAQQKALLESLNSGEAHLNAERRARVLEELGFIESNDGAVEILLEEVMKNERITARVDELVQSRVEEQVKRKNEVATEIAQLEQRAADLKRRIAKEEKEQRALPPSVARAIKESLVKAKDDAMGTLGQVVVFKALMDQCYGAQPLGHQDLPAPQTFRLAESSGNSLQAALKALGIRNKHARALEIIGEMAFATGLPLVIEGTASRLAAEAWAATHANGSKIMECGIGLIDDTALRGIGADETRTVVILDANLSPIDVYARPLIDHVQRRISGLSLEKECPRIVMSLSNGVAGLPLPKIVESISVRVSLDSEVEFFADGDAQAKLDDLESEENGSQWSTTLWKPASKALLAYLRRLPVEEAALAVSVLEAVRH